MTTVRQSELRGPDSSLLGAGGLVQRSREFSRPVYLAVVIGLSTLTFGLGLTALALTPSEGTAAIWWPAAGTSALLYLLYRGPRWQILSLVAAVAILSNLAVGRPPVYALWAVIILVTELLIFAWLLGPQGRVAMLSSTKGLFRFVLASAAAAAAVGVIGAISFALLVGANPVTTFAALVPSHLSALLLIVPLALVPLRGEGDGQKIELLVHGVLTLVVTFLVFAPFQTSAIVALLFPFLGWAAVRFHPIVATVQIILLGVIGSVLTVLGGGPYGTTFGALPTAVLAQINLMSIALTIHYITVVRSERSELRAENERRAALLRGGFVGSQVGSLFVRADRDSGPQMLEINEVAAELIDAAWLDPLITASLSSGDDDFSTEVLLDDGRTVQVYGRYVETADRKAVLGLQLVDISDFVAAQDALAHAVERERRVAEELRELARQKDDFVSAVSHELRTPITSIVGFAEELHETTADEQRQASTIILRNAHRLSEMVEDLLELSHMTAPNPVTDRNSIDVTAIAADAADDQSTTARSQGVTIDTAFCEHPALVMGTANALGRIATNLIANAIKFTPADGTVRVSTTCTDRDVVLTVDDSGPGISDEDRPRVFERFFRSADVTKRQRPGTGLGLSIVKSLVELLDGQIDIERSPLGGARLTVTLPRTAEPAATS